MKNIFTIFICSCEKSCVEYRFLFKTISIILLIFCFLLYSRLSTGFSENLVLTVQSPTSTFRRVKCALCEIVSEEE